MRDLFEKGGQRRLNEYCTLSLSDSDARVFRVYDTTERDVITAQDALLQSQLSVLGAGLEHHKTRLKLLKDIGTLNTTQDEFWLKNVGVPELQQPQPGELPQPLEEVVPPEQILGQ